MSFCLLPQPVKQVKCKEVEMDPEILGDVVQVTTGFVANGNTALWVRFLTS